MSVIDILRERLHDPEDQFTERKEKGSSEDIAETLVAFANTLPHGHEAVLFLGITDSGEIRGVENSDKIQRNVQRIAANRCYPPIPLQHMIVLNEEGKEVIAVVVTASDVKPHFAGPAYVRIGSQNVRASDEMLNRLIDTRHSKAQLILEAMELGQKVSVRLIGSNPVRGIRTVQAEVRECNSHYVRLSSNDGLRSFPLKRVELCWDENKDRLVLEVQSEFRS